MDYKPTLSPSLSHRMGGGPKGGKGTRVVYPNDSSVSQPACQHRSAQPKPGQLQGDGLSLNSS
jgi:hypothetical protein